MTTPTPQEIADAVQLADDLAAKAAGRMTDAEALAAKDDALAAMTAARDAMTAVRDALAAQVDTLTAKIAAAVAALG